MTAVTGRSAVLESERVTVNLNVPATKALAEVSALTGDTKTDSINRALQLYAMIVAVQLNGGTIHMRERPDADLERLRLL